VGFDVMICFTGRMDMILPSQMADFSPKMVSRMKPARRHIVDTGQIGPPGPLPGRLWI
jgi:hypothetical protein